jgi:hypothetical protein
MVGEWREESERNEAISVYFIHQIKLHDLAENLFNL